jgi:hypothetical protein
VVAVVKEAGVVEAAVTGVEAAVTAVEAATHCC